jgi:hypothetical protein
VLSGNGERVRLRGELIEQKKRLAMASKVLARLRNDNFPVVDLDATMEDVYGNVVPTQSGRNCH